MTIREGRSRPPSASLAIGAVGPEAGRSVYGPAGVGRSKAGAQLRFVTADALHWRERFGSAGKDPRSFLHDMLIDPTMEEVFDALHIAREFLARGWSPSGMWGGEFCLFFSGHGERDGSVVFRDGTIPLPELLGVVAAGIPARTDARLKLGVALDACFGGAALCGALYDLPDHVFLRTGLASSLHDEESFEYGALGHGLFTYVMKHQTPLEERGRTVRDLLVRQGWTIGNGELIPPDPWPSHSALLPARQELSERLASTVVDLEVVPYLSGREQHVLDIMNGHSVRVRGQGEIDLADCKDLLPLNELLARVEGLREAPLDLGIRYPGFSGP